MHFFVDQARKAHYCDLHQFRAVGLASSVVVQNIHQLIGGLLTFGELTSPVIVTNGCIIRFVSQQGGQYSRLTLSD